MSARPRTNDRLLSRFGTFPRCAPLFAAPSLRPHKHNIGIVVGMFSPSLQLVRMLVFLCLMLTCRTALAAAPRDEKVLSADDYPTLQAAIDALAGGGAVALGPRVYKLTSPLRLHSGQSLIGQAGLSRVIWSGDDQPVIEVRGVEGPVTSRIEVSSEGTISVDSAFLRGRAYVRVIAGRGSEIPVHEELEVLETSAGARPKMRLQLEYPSGAELVEFSPVQNILISGISIDGKNSAESGVVVRNAVDVEIRDCAIANTRYGIYASDAYRLFIANNKIEATSIAAIAVVRSSGGTIQNNKLMSSMETGIFCGFGCWSFRIDGNYINATGIRDDAGNGGGDGMTFFGAGNLLISNNMIVRAGCYGIWAVRHFSHAILHGNAIIGGITGAIFLNGHPASLGTAGTVQIGENVIVNNIGASVLLSPARRAVVRENIVGGRPKRAGVLTYGEFGEPERDTRIGDNIVLRKSAGERDEQLDKGDVVTVDRPLWPRAIPSPLQWEEFADYAIRGVPTNECVRVEGIGIDRQGACLVVRDGIIKPVDEHLNPLLLQTLNLIKDVKTTIADDRIPERGKAIQLAAGQLEAELAVIDGPTLTKHVTPGVTTIKSRRLSGFVRLDIYADNTRVAILPLWKTSEIQLVTWQVSLDPEVSVTFDLPAAGRYRFVLIDEGGAAAPQRTIDIPYLELVHGAWPFPLRTPMTQRISRNIRWDKGETVRSGEDFR
jgi:hypothetical protein